MKKTTYILIALSFLACKKTDFSGNLGTCKSVYESNSNSIVIQDQIESPFCLLEGMDYSIDISNLNLTNIEWDKGDSTNTVLVNGKGTYQGFGINNNNDTVLFIFDAVDCDNHVYIPNSFTPNSDGINDLWQLKFAYSTICNENFELSIFDPHHKLIYKTNDLYSNWNGSIKDNPAPQGIYHYILQYKREDGEAIEKNGQFLLIY